MTVVVRRRLKRKVKIFLTVIIILILSLVTLFFIIIHNTKIEVGTELKIDNIVLPPLNNICKLDKEREYNKVGRYNVELICFNFSFTRKVTVVDTTPPEVETKKYITYKDEIKPEKFIVSVKDASDYTSKLIGDYRMDTKENQKLTLVVTDEYGNETKKEVILQISDDGTPPVFKGVDTISIVVGDSVDFNEGVKSVDEIDGECDYSLDTSKVDLTTPGMYFATYTTSDLSDNETIIERKVVVVEDNQTNRALRDFYNKYLKGKSLHDMAVVVRTKIKYAHESGGDNAVYYALKNRKGSCRVHAYLFRAILDFAGYENMLVYNTSSTHLWNLVYDDGKWRHYDSTPGNKDIGPNTDKEIENSPNKKWDRSKYPKAE